MTHHNVGHHFPHKPQLAVNFCSMDYSLIKSLNMEVQLKQCRFLHSLNPSISIIRICKHQHCNPVSWTSTACVWFTSECQCPFRVNMLNSTVSSALYVSCGEYYLFIPSTPLSMNRHHYLHHHFLTTNYFNDRCCSLEICGASPLFSKQSCKGSGLLIQQCECSLI